MENTMPQIPQPEFIPETQVVPPAATNSLKILVMGLLVLLPVVGVTGYYLGMNTTNNSTPANNSIVLATPTSNPEVGCTLDAKMCPDGSSVGRVGPTCEFEECPVTGNNTNTSEPILKGYYRQYDGTKWEWGNAQVTCDGFVTLSGNEEMIAEFKSSAEAGNTLNKFIGNDFVINIDLSTLSAAEKKVIEQSSASKPVELNVVKKNEPGRSASTCYSLIDIISVN